VGKKKNTFKGVGMRLAQAVVGGWEGLKNLKISTRDGKEDGT